MTDTDRVLAGGSICYPWTAYFSDPDPSTDWEPSVTASA